MRIWSLYNTPYLLYEMYIINIISTISNRYSIDYSKSNHLFLQTSSSKAVEVQIEGPSKVTEISSKKVSETSKKVDETSKKSSETPKKPDKTPKNVTETPKKVDEKSKKMTESSKSVPEVEIADDFVVGHKMPKLSFQFLEENSSTTSLVNSFFHFFFVSLIYFSATQITFIWPTKIKKVKKCN